MSSVNRPDKTGASLAMLALGVVGDTPPSPGVQPTALPDGIHLRWAFLRDMGFPWYGFYLFRRVTPGGTKVCLAQQLSAQGAVPGPVGAPALTVPNGTLSSDQNLVLTDQFPPSGAVEVDLSGRTFVGFKAASGTWRQVDVTIGFLADFPPAGGGNGPGGGGGPGGGLGGGPGNGPGGGGGPSGSGPGGGLGGGPGGPGDGGGGPGGGGLGSPGAAVRDCGCTCGQTVVPVLESVVNLGNGQFRATFGYSNSGRTPVSIPIGPQNGFFPGPANQGQPTLFMPGRQTNVFTVTFSGTPLTWSLGGIGLVTTSADATPPGSGGGVVVSAYSQSTLVAQTVVSGLQGAVVVGSLVAETIDEVRVSSGPACLVDVCTIDTDDSLGQGWVPVPNLPQPICLPVSHPDYPCNPGPVDENAARALAFSRLTYGGTDPWTGVNAGNFDDFHATLVDLVTGGPSKGITDDVESVTAPVDPANPDATPPTISESALDVLLGASINPAVAQMLGLYWADQATIEGQSYDYLVVGDYENTGKGDITVIEALIAASDFDRLFAYLKSGVFRSASPPLATPASVAGYVLPLGAIPTSVQGDVAGQVGLRWDIPVANDSNKLAPTSAVLFNVWRDDLGTTAPTAPAPADAHHLITSTPVAAGLSRTQAPDPQLEGWPSVGLFDLDGPLSDGWYGYRASGIDIFGRHSVLSDPAAWLSVTDGSLLSSLAVHIQDVTPPPPPAQVQAWAQDPGDPFLTKDAAYQSQSAAFKATLGLRVRWLWTGSQMRQAPDLREFRLYFNPGSSLDASTDPDSYAQRITVVGAGEHIVSDLVRPFQTVDGVDLTGIAATASGANVTLDGALSLTDVPIDAAQLQLTDAVGGPVRLRVLAVDSAARVVTLESAPTLAGTSSWILGSRELTYEIFLPNDDSTLNQAFVLPLSVSQQNPTLYGLVGVSAADDKVGTADTRTTGPLAGRYGNESGVGGPATVYAVNRKPPDPPALGPFPTDHLFATRADFYSQSFFAVHWPKSANLFTHVFRAVDATLFAVDQEQRFASPSTATDAHTVSAAALGWTPARRDSVANVVNGITSLDHYAGLSDDALRLLASLPSNQEAFIRLTQGPLDPNDPGNADAVGPNDDPSYTPSSQVALFVDDLDGRAQNRYFYRTASVDGAQNTGDMGVSTPPVYLPEASSPAAPIVTAAVGLDHAIEVDWRVDPDRGISSVKIYRTDDVTLTGDVRLMDLIATVPVTDASPAGAFTDTGPPLLRPVYYRLTALTTAGEESAASAAVSARATRGKAPDPPVLAAQVLGGAPPVVRLTWTTTEPLQVIVQRSVLDGDPIWTTVAKWVAAGTVTADDDGVQPGVTYVYRARGRDETAVQSDLSNTVQVSPA